MLSELVYGFANRLRHAALFLLMFRLVVSGYGQVPDTTLVGQWKEVRHKQKGYYLYLDIEFRPDSTANYYTRYPESSEGLRYQLTNRTLTLLRTTKRIDQFRIVHYADATLTLRNLKSRRLIVLTRKK